MKTLVSDNLILAGYNMYLIHELDTVIYVAIVANVTVVANVADKFAYQAITEMKAHWR